MTNDIDQAKEQAIRRDERDRIAAQIKDIKFEVDIIPQCKPFRQLRSTMYKIALDDVLGLLGTEEAK